MSHKKLTDEELFAQFEDIPSTEAPAVPSTTTRSAKGTKGAPPPSSSLSPAAAATVDDDDPLAELTALAAARPASRPTTPRLSSTTTSSTATKRNDHTPASSGPPSNRTSEDHLHTAATTVPRKSTESTRSNLNQSFVAEDRDEEAPHQGEVPSQPAAASSGEGVAASAGGGWWGSVFNGVTAAVKQAEAAVKEIRGNEEVLKYAEQVKGNAKLLREYGGNVRSLALPTFHSLIETIAPPISAHERLQIHITHDIQGYPSLDPLIYSVFARVMSQVEGGDLLVIQKGSESRARSTSDAAYKGSVLGGSTGWSDGPWWRDETKKRDIAAIKGIVEGTKLARASAEAYSTEFFASRGGIEEAAKQATHALSETNPVRSSDIFLAIQAITISGDKSLFQSAPAAVKEADEAGVEAPEEDNDDSTAFAIFLHDPIHSLSFSTLSQGFPAKWSEWLDESSTSANALPESIKEIVESGGIDPREWIAEWMEETLSLSIGIVAQRYVAKRMGVGEGGIGKGKGRARAEEDAAAGEAYRAM